MQSRKYVLPIYRITKTCDFDEPKASKVNFKRLNSEELYFHRPIYHPRANLNFFPAVLQADGSPWKFANIYLIDRILNSLNLSTTTLSSISKDLVSFKKFLEQNEIDFLDFPKLKFDRPTYRYRKYLLECLSQKILSRNTARRKIQTIIIFYRWLLENNKVVLENPPWVDGEAYITFKTRDGLSNYKTVKTTNLSIRTPASTDPHADYIQDGGRLKPLSSDDQAHILKALQEIGNTKHALIHYIALFSGARLQTVLTLRYENFSSPIDENDHEVRIPVGFGTHADTKFDKQMVLHFPAWLYRKIQIFIKSPLFFKVQRGKDAERYIFTTSSGEPYYYSKEDLKNFNGNQTSSQLKTGAAIQSFISSKIIPHIQLNTQKKIHYRFHDLRASFGMNLTESCLKQVEKKVINLHQAREYVRVRMGHSSSATTDLYLSHKGRSKFLTSVQQDYESLIESLIGSLK